jgi:hypothetical protein
MLKLTQIIYGCTREAALVMLALSLKMKPPVDRASEALIEMMRLRNTKCLVTPTYYWGLYSDAVEEIKSYLEKEGVWK